MGIQQPHYSDRDLTDVSNVHVGLAAGRGMRDDDNRTQPLLQLGQPPLPEYAPGERPEMRLVHESLPELS